MSTSTAAPTAAPASDDHGRPTFGSLVRGELLRLRSRRLVVIVLLLGVLLMGVAAVGVLLTSGSTTAADLAAAQQEADNNEQSCRESAKDDPGITASDLDSLCEQQLEWYISKQPFTWDGGYKEGIFAVAVGFAAMMFLIGASAGGAEWSARTMPALLYWEPRRLRVMAAKVLTLGGCAAVLGVLAQLLWLGIAWVLESLRGVNAPIDLGDTFISDVAGIATRGVLLAVLVAVGAFALANLTRNTGAALGIAFVYFAIAEPVISGLRPGLSRWQLTLNVGALLDPGGLEVPGRVVRLAGGETQIELFVLTNARAALTLSAVVAITLAVAVVLFRRRDIA